MHAPQGLPGIVQPVVVNPQTISWYEDIEEFIETQAFQG